MFVSNQLTSTFTTPSCDHHSRQRMCICRHSGRDKYIEGRHMYLSRRLGWSDGLTVLGYMFERHRWPGLQWQRRLHSFRCQVLYASPACTCLSLSSFASSWTMLSCPYIGRGDREYMTACCCKISSILKTSKQIPKLDEIFLSTLMQPSTFVDAQTGVGAASCVCARGYRGNACEIECKGGHANPCSGGT